MAAKPIVITDYENPIETARQNWQREQNKKIIGDKKLQFNHRPLDKEKSPKKYLYNTMYNDKAAANLINENDHIVQPSMRFKPRTDLERIIDGVTANRGMVDPHILKSHLRKLKLNIVKKSKKDTEMFDETKKTKARDESESSSSEDYFPKKQEVKEDKVLKKKIKRIMKNPEAKNVLQELHNKTYFKAASVYTLTTGSKGYIAIKSMNPTLNFKQLINDKVKEIKMEKKPITLENEELLSNNTNPPKFNVPEDEDLEIISLNPLIYGLTAESRNTQKKTVKKEFNVDLKKLKELAFNLNPEDAMNIKSNNKMSQNVIKKMFERNKKRKNFADIKEEEKIKIDDKYYSKNQVKEIAKKILKKCNFIHDKHKQNN